MSGQILVGDVREQLRTLSADSVHCVVTSPPYWSLRSYSTTPQLWGGDPDCTHEWSAEPTAEGYTGKRWWQNGTNAGGIEAIKRKDAPDNWSQVTRGDTCRLCGCWRGELGGEPTPDCLGWATGDPCGRCYVCHIVEVFREVRRVLRRDGTVWANWGDSFAANWSSLRSEGGGGFKANGRERIKHPPPGLKSKDLCMIPARCALALQADGWWIRMDCIWSKPNPMPESVTDRPTKSHEYVFMLSRSSRYFYDAEAVREEGAGRLDLGVMTSPARLNQGGPWVHTHKSEPGRNRRSVWEIPTSPLPEAHFASYPEKLVEPCILAGTSEWGVCRQCGAPWRRVTDTTYQRHRVAINRTAPREHSSYIASRGEVLNKHVETTGWQPSCKHPGDPIPATVLDPFLGSGTTGRVAERLGRNWIGIELNENYAAIARRRTAQAGLFQFAAAAGGAE